MLLILSSVRRKTFNSNKCCIYIYHKNKKFWTWTVVDFKNLLELWMPRWQIWWKWKIFSLIQILRIIIHAIMLLLIKLDRMYPIFYNNHSLKKFHLGFIECFKKWWLVIYNNVNQNKDRYKFKLYQWSQ